MRADPGHPAVKAEPQADAVAAPAGPSTSEALGGGDASQTRRWLLAIYGRLMAHYGAPEERPLQDPLSELIQTVLSQNTADVNSDRAYASLYQRYRGDWEAVRSAPIEEVAESIRSGGLAEIKAARIQGILNTLAERLGELDLSFLRAVSLEEGRAFLRTLDGVGPKTAACVLLFACGQPAMPVDTHVHRVSQRLGLVPANTNAERTHALLEAVVPPDLVYAVHMQLIRHGREICKAQRPRCTNCPAADLCPSYPTLSTQHSALSTQDSG